MSIHIPEGSVVGSNSGCDETQTRNRWPNGRDHPRYLARNGDPICQYNTIAQIMVALRKRAEIKARHILAVKSWTLRYSNSQFD